MLATNQPYVKQFDEQGILKNPIIGSYRHKSPNRAKRREPEGRALSNKKGIQLVVIGNTKFKKQQVLVDGKLRVVSNEVPHANSGKRARVTEI